MKLYIILLTLILSTAVILADKPPVLQRFEYSEVEMGVRARIVVYAASREYAEKGCRSAFDRINILENVMSDYRPDSELMKLSSKAGTGPVKVSDDLLRVLRISQDLSKRSDGAFDITVGPVVKLWRKARKSGALPPQAELDAAQKLVGWRKIVIDGKRSTVALETPGMQLDLGGIAKGYACQEAIKSLRRKGIGRALVEMGGDIVVSGPPPGKKGWAIENENAHNAADKLLILHDCAVSSSGDVEQFVEIGGKRYSHIVDPKTGVGLTSRTAVTIIAPSGDLSDGLSTALCVLGEKKGRALLRDYPRVRAWYSLAHD